VNINIFNDADEIVDDINSQTQKALSYRADNVSYFPETTNQYKPESNSMDTIIDHGENTVVKTESFTDSVDYYAAETGRVLIGGLGYVADKFIGLIDNLDDLIDSPVERLLKNHYGFERGLIDAGKIQSKVASTKIPTTDMTVNDWYKDNFEAKTEIGKLLTPIAAEISAFALNNIYLKKAGLALPAAGSNQWKKYAVDVMRWATAEGAVGFTMGEDQSSAMLWMADMLGITDENTLPAVRETYKQLLDSQAPEDEFKLRMMNTLDRFALGASADVLLTFLLKMYKPMIGLGLSSTVTFDTSLNNQVKKNIQNLGIENGK
tara:strand:+ start:2249 stop:3208 length:960 start_codon:yes stop_codon:yes gene_type:complete